MTLDLVWMAVFNDGKIVYQFDDEEQTQEHPFREVLDRQDDLQVFNLVNRNTGTVYQVNLERGRIHIFKPGTFVTKPEAEVEGNADSRYRLVYFRRVTQELSWNPSAGAAEGPTSVVYFLGFQSTAPDGKTVRRVLQIMPNDEVYTA